jgi:hypothetical protein
VGALIVAFRFELESDFCCSGRLVGDEVGERFESLIVGEGVAILK